MMTWRDHNYFYENSYYVWVFYTSMTPEERLAFEKADCECCVYDNYAAEQVGADAYYEALSMYDENEERLDILDWYLRRCVEK